MKLLIGHFNYRRSCWIDQTSYFNNDINNLSDDSDNSSDIMMDALMHLFLSMSMKLSKCKGIKGSVPGQSPALECNHEVVGQDEL
jgi:hypothetical protein